MELYSEFQLIAAYYSTLLVFNDEIQCCGSLSFEASLYCRKDVTHNLSDRFI